ncbi:DUF7433 family protein [Mycolicibacterium mageritense]|uniref:DUF7433 family protein n=1 Tax=Mycolicibacterium mageritense TaxID=53462 RepID=UPI001E50AC6F|nr:hypothetical protein [Mycolicibacterium mageritense]MCC9181153.1 hypothetical protein [Mycolicibacterium mageritense]
MSAPQPGSRDHERVEVMTSLDDDVLLMLVVHTDGRVRFNGRAAADKPWVADTLERILAAVRAETNGQ